MIEPVSSSGPDPALEAIEIELLLTGLAQRYGFDFRNYSRASLTRRIRSAQHGEGASSISSLQEKLLHDPVATLRFVEALSVHTTEMFRDADVYRALRDDVIPLLRTYPFVRIWHAGCSTGEEVYSLAILLHEAGLYERCRIYATDISDRVLKRAQDGVFPLHNMRQYTRAYQRAGGREDFSSYYVADHEQAIFRQSLRRQLVFSQHSLVCDAAFNEFHLIVCRNVLLYFDQLLRQRALDLFHSSLIGLGMLVLGKKESLEYTPLVDNYEEVRPSLRIYRRRR
jgi:chemotaxis protein methyltransferase CheR